MIQFGAPRPLRAKLRSHSTLKREPDLLEIGGMGANLSGMPRQPEIKVPRRSASVFYGARHKFAQLPASFLPRRSSPSLSSPALSLSRRVCRLLSQIYGLIDSSCCGNLPEISRGWSSALTIGRPAPVCLFLFPTIFPAVVLDSYLAGEHANPPDSPASS